MKRHHFHFAVALFLLGTGLYLWPHLGAYFVFAGAAVAGITGDLTRKKIVD